MTILSSKNQRPIEVFIHIIIWMLILFLPILFLSGDKSISEVSWTDYLIHLKMSLCVLVVFYINYLILVPFLLIKKHNKRFYLSNVVLIIIVLLLIHYRDEPYENEKQKPPFESEMKDESMALPDNFWGDGPQEEFLPAPPRIPFEHERPPFWTFAMRDILLFLCTIGVSAAIRISGEWNKAELALQESEKAKSEAILNNLRNQLNPHFLLNTLNNIYALIAFDSEKAQQAVQDLSKLLRYVLYENQQMYVPLSREIEFLSNYIQLMRIRLSKEVRVYININVPANSTVQIAPLIFISLIENAFKHGISPTEPSFISIAIAQVDQKEIRCEILNSNHPKNNSDKSGSGIGLEQVQKRLDLLYANRYEWKKGVSENGEVYSSVLIIHI